MPQAQLVWLLYIKKNSLVFTNIIYYKYIITTIISVHFLTL